MFGKVQEDSFQNIFDLSLDDFSYDSKSLGLGLGLGSPTTTSSSGSDSLAASLLSSALRDQQAGYSKSSRRIWGGNSLLHIEDDEDNLSYAAATMDGQQQESELHFSHSQLDQLRRLQQLTLKDSSSGISSPTSSVASSSSFTNNFDIPTFAPRQQQNAAAAAAAFSRGFFPSSEDHNLAAFDSHSDAASTSSSSSSTSSNAGSSSSAITSRYKTEMCRPFQENGTCKYGEKCQFAHGIKELRTVARHPKYKTDLCRTYHSSGFCPYGPRCHFIHNLDESANSSANKASGAAKKAGGNKDSREAGKMAQLPMFSSVQRNSPVYQPSQFQRHSQSGSRPAPSAGATGGHPLKKSGRSGASTDGGDAIDNQIYARLPVFSTLSH